MIYRIGIENNNDGFRTIAWVLDHPGCFSYGDNADQAIDILPDAIFNYAAWAQARGADWINVEQIELAIDETFECYPIDEKTFERVEKDGSMVESSFLHDWKPLTHLEIERALRILDWTRNDLLSIVGHLDPEKLAATHPGERWSIDGILRHIGGAEWWYMERLGRTFPESELPKAPRERLDKVRAALVELLPQLEGVNQVVGLEGELWSPRKVLRRAVWHERDHVDHIRKLI
jgi:hypothetical protein